MEIGRLASASGIEGARLLWGGNTSLDITHIAEDSRRVEPGGLFVAVRGSAHDGHRFIPQALQQGAVAVAGEREERPEGLPDEIPYLHVPGDRQAVARLSAAFFDFPSRKLQVVGVT